MDNLKFEEPGKERSACFIEVFAMRWAKKIFEWNWLKKASNLGQCASVLALGKTSIYAAFLGFKYPLFNIKITIIIYNLVEKSFFLLYNVLVS